MPIGRGFGHVNVVYGRSVHMYGWEGEKRGLWGLSKGTKNGAVDSEHRASKGRGSELRTKEPPFQVRGLFFILNIHKYYTCNNISCTMLCI